MGEDRIIESCCRTVGDEKTETKTKSQRLVGVFGCVMAGLEFGNVMATFYIRKQQLALAFGLLFEFNFFIFRSLLSLSSLLKYM